MSVEEDAMMNLALEMRRRFLLAWGTIALGSQFRIPAHARPARSATADACVLIFLNGGMSHLDTFDPKPDQPAEIRGEFAAIRTSVPGMLVGEHLPRLAR